MANPSHHQADTQHAEASRCDAPVLTRAATMATGHQAWFWHPGILVKLLAGMRMAQQVDGQVMYLVVDHDPLETLTLDLPVIDAGDDAAAGSRLHVQTLKLAEIDPLAPTGCQPAVDMQAMLGVLEDTQNRLGDTLAVDMKPLMDAVRVAGDAVEHQHATFATQITAITLELIRTLICEPCDLRIDTLQLRYSSGLLQTGPGRELVQRMVHDAAACVGHFNAAATAHSQAGVRSLLVERDRVELPLWLLRWQQPRQRVFADLADHQPALVTIHGQPIDMQQATLAPRALTQSALMRSTCCDLFIHGSGGAAYDRATEQWWQAWTGQKLRPMRTVSIDLHLPLNVPVATRADVVRAVWYRHHLPHNVDRVLKLNSPAAQRKQHLLARMKQDRDRQRKRRAFDEIHQINAQLAATHSHVIRQAQADVRQAQQGLRNRAIARRRDWCFALYPPEQLQQLARQVHI